eukprot:TRINITY_DN28201_c0_g1_i1.p1 TRINITY_DN28201_c0_g1~~TRINITY_DN28201_c0_g1_i1.p1  ORF type:complete len:138 (+),score=26.30 TRINITY_DN28201_c0_g1_i1:50-415(+)
MRVIVKDCSGAQFYVDAEVNDTVASIKQKIHDSEGTPTEMQSLFCVENKHLLTDSILVSDIESHTDNVELYLHYGLNGGGSAHFDLGEFELKCRVCCFYTGLDGKWNKCQFLCARCECSIM